MSKKVVLITGTNSGFGYLTALGAAERGYSVYATMRNTDGRNSEKAKELQAIDGVHVIELDVTDSNGVKNAVAKIISTEGRLDVLVNNAGYFGGGLGCELQFSFEHNSIDQTYDPDSRNSLDVPGSKTYFGSHQRIGADHVNSWAEWPE